MAQTNSNASHVLDTTQTVLPSSVAIPPAGMITATTRISTILGSDNVGNIDGSNNFPNSNYNDNYSTALNYTDAVDVKVRTNTATLLANNVGNVQFLPTEAVAKTEWNADDKPADIAGSYIDATAATTAWKAAPKLTGNASAFTLQNANDTGKTVTLTETINGSPFTTGNGAVSEALTFTGTTNDVLTVKHNVAVANVPATTNNNNNASALDVRNESYAETYAKQGVTSNYAWNSAHKYVEVNGNQALNDAFAQTYAYRDDKLTINSAVKTGVANEANINGAEKIAESNSANYSYKAASGSVDYVVTDTRNLAQADQRTWTNTTVTNVAKFEVKDLVNATTITAKGLVTGTTTNLSTAANVALPTQFKSTGAEFKIDSAHYALAVDAKVFDLDHSNARDNGSNALLALVDTTSSTGDVFTSALGNGKVPVLFNKYVSVATDTLTGTQFTDVITIKDVAGTVAGTFVGGKVIAGFGNDTITGSKGDDTLTGSDGADTFNLSVGKDVITDFVLGTDAIAKGTGTAKVTITYTDADGKAKTADYNVVGSATTDGAIPALNADKKAFTKADLDKLAADPKSGVTPDKLNLVGTDKDDVLVGGTSDDTLNGGKGADKLTGGAGADKFIFTDLTNGIANRVDTITDFSKTAGDRIDVSALGFKTFVDGAFTAANSANALRFDAATQTLQGNTGDLTKIELEIKVIGDAPTATDFIFA